MRLIPVDTSGMSFLAAGDAQPRLRNRETGELRTTEDGTPVYVLPVMAIREGRGELVNVSFASREVPAFTAGVPVVVEGLTAFPWEANGRHGIAFRAASVRPAASAVRGVA